MRRSPSAGSSRCRGSWDEPPRRASPGRDGRRRMSATGADSTRLSAAALRDRIIAGDLTAAAATEACLRRIAAVDGTIGAFVTVDADGARAAAEAIDADR